ncbi:MAG: PHP domain-containing protein [Lachnospiraceae bacterium]|nr:PHP domain-containing protein [Lachnospiraceae bacterium]
MKQQQAFSGNEKMLKGALHCHTTRSDGRGTPEEVIRYHYQHGYDFLAITDHRNYNLKNFAPDVPITIIPGMEYDSHIEWKNGFRCFHTVCVGPVTGNGFKQDEQPESGKASNQEEYQPYLDDIHAKGNLTIYCHPEWSSTPARYFENQKGNFAMEIWNSGCALNCDMDTDAAYWDEILGQGKVLYGVATDDGHAMEEHCNGWVMVRAENNVNAILEALKAGEFYSSCGPEIYNFYVEDGKAVVECSPVAKIRFHSDKNPTRIVRSADGTMTRAEIDLADTWWASSGEYKYVRATVIDKNGKYAWTNPIFL